MRVAVICEFSGIVRDAFLARSHDATSFDLLETERPGPHVVGDCRLFDWAGFDLAICHPPCTYLCLSGARWWAGRQQEQAAALDFVRWCLALPVPRIAVENPPGKIGTAIRRADQYIQPWQFGHGETKKTGLWLVNLPRLTPTNIVAGRAPTCHLQPPGPNRWRERSRTYTGIAGAMAEQWGALPTKEDTQ